MRGLAVLLVSVLASSGCLDDLGDAIRGDDYVFADLLGGQPTVTFSYEGAFDPTAPPGSPDEAYDRSTLPFSVPPGSSLLTVTYAVTMDEAGSELPVPQELREVRVSLLDPAGETVKQAGLASSGDGEWEVVEPADGDWSLVLEARANGEATLSAGALVPD